LRQRTVPESQAFWGLNTASEFGLFRNCPLCIGAWDSGTVGSLETGTFEIIALNQKKLLNLLTNFLRSFQIQKGPTSDIGTLIRS
jgi:hypothetical protein